MVKHKPTTVGEWLPKDTKLNEITSRCTQCTACPLHKKRAAPITGRGNENANVFIVLGSHVQEAVSSGCILSGPVKRYICYQLGKCNKTLSDVWVTTSTACPPSRMTVPTDKEVDRCKEHVYKEIHLVRPHIVIAMGTMAIKTMFPKQGKRPSLQEHEGKVLVSSIPGDITTYDIPVMLTAAPSLLLRGPDYSPYGSIRRMTSQLRRAFAAADELDEITLNEG